MEWNTDHGVAIKNIVYDVQLPFVSAIGCLSRPGETLQYKGNKKREGGSISKSTLGHGL